MSTSYGVNATKRANQTIKDLEAQGEHKSPLLVAYDSFTMTAALSQNDTIRFMKLPPLARIHDVYITVTVSMDAAAGTLDVGWETSSADTLDADGFLASVDVTAAATFSMRDDQGTRPGINKQFGNAETQVYATATHSGGLDATTGVMQLTVLYTVS